MVHPKGQLISKCLFGRIEDTKIHFEINWPFNEVCPVNWKSTTPLTNVQHHAQDGLGQYAYGYSSPTSQKSEVKTADGVTRGSYQYGWFFPMNLKLLNWPRLWVPVSTFRKWQYFSFEKFLIEDLVFCSDLLWEKLKKLETEEKS